jgi:hypothetical protein
MMKAYVPERSSSSEERRASVEGASLAPPAYGLSFIDNQLVQRKENNTGMPDPLKSGIESLSGMNMDDVQVHYNSAKPAQLQAHAYAQGSDIHISPGQEKHLPHEAWHVVQQKQGRVKPTMQLKEKVDVNDEPSLEQEADTMGQVALGMGGGAKDPSLTPTRHSPNPVQAKFNSLVFREGKIGVESPGKLPAGSAPPVQAVFVYSFWTNAIAWNPYEDAYYERLGFVKVKSKDGHDVWVNKLNAHVVPTLIVDPVVLKQYEHGDKPVKDPDPKKTDPKGPDSQGPLPPGPLQQGGPPALPAGPLPVEHIGNSCYLATILTLIAAVPKYTNGLFDPIVNVLTPGSDGNALQQLVHPILLRIGAGHVAPPPGQIGQPVPQRVRSDEMANLIQQLVTWHVITGNADDQQSAPEIMGRMLRLVEPTNYRNKREYFPRTQEQVTYDALPAIPVRPVTRTELRGEQFQYIIEVPASRFRTLEEALISEFPREQRRDTQTLGTPVANPNVNRISLTSYPDVLTFSVVHESDRNVLEMPSSFQLPEECYTPVVNGQPAPYYKLKGFVAHSQPGQDLFSHRRGHFVAYTHQNDNWFHSDDLGGPFNFERGVREPIVRPVPDIGRERYEGHQGSTVALGSIYTYEKIVPVGPFARQIFGPVEVDEPSDVLRDLLVDDFAMLVALMPKEQTDDKPLFDLRTLLEKSMTVKEVKPGLYDELRILRGELSKLEKAHAGGSALLRTRYRMALSACDFSLNILINNGLTNKTMKPVVFRDVAQGATWEHSELTWRDWISGSDKPKDPSISSSSKDTGKDKGGTTTPKQDYSAIKPAVVNKLRIITATQVGIDLPADVRADILLDDLQSLYDLSGSKKTFAEFVNEKLDSLVPPELPKQKPGEKIAEFMKRIPDPADRKILAGYVGTSYEGLLQLLLGFDIAPLVTGVGLKDTDTDDDKAMRLAQRHAIPLKRSTETKDALKPLVLKYDLLRNIALPSLRNTVAAMLDIKPRDFRPKAEPFIASKEEAAMLSEYFGTHAAEGIVGSVEKRALGLTGARGKVETLGRVEKKLEEFASGPPLTGQSLVVDTNAMRLFIYHHEDTEMNYRDRGIFSHLLRIVKERNISELCLPNMAYIETANHYPAILSMDRIKVAGKVLRIRGVPLTVKRSSADFERSYNTLGTGKVGGDKENSSADITIVNDALHAKATEVPTFTTNDRGIFDALWKLARTSLTTDALPDISRIALLRDDIIAKAPQRTGPPHPDYQYEKALPSFDLIVDGHTINVVPVGDSISQYWEPQSEHQKQVKATRDTAPNPFADDLFYQLPLGANSNWLVGDLFRMIHDHGKDAWITGGAVRALQQYLQANSKTIQELTIEAQRDTARWREEAGKIFRDIDIVTTMTDKELLAALSKDTLLSNVHMEHEPARHMVSLAGGHCEISCSKTEKTDKSLDLESVMKGQDFTINSLFYKRGQGIADPSKTGIADLAANRLMFSSAVGGDKGLIELLYQQPYLLGRLIKFMKLGYTPDKAQLKVLVDNFGGAVNALKTSSKETTTGKDIYAIKMILTKSGFNDSHAITKAMLELGFSMDDIRLVLPGEAVGHGVYAGWLTAGFKDPVTDPGWVEAPQPDVKLNLETGKVVGSRIYCRDPDGDALIIDVEYRIDPHSRREIPFYRIWRHELAKWTDQESGLSATGQRGLPPIENGIYQGKRPWKIAHSSDPGTDWVRWLKTQGGIKVKFDADFVNLNGFITIHRDALRNILTKDPNTARKFVTLVQNGEDPEAMFDVQDEALRTFTGKKENYRLRFKAMLKEIYQFAMIAGIDLTAKPLDDLNATTLEGLRARIRFYDLLAVKHAPWQLSVANAFAMQGKPASVSEYVDRFEFALANNLKQKEDIEHVDSRWKAVNVSAITGTVEVPDFFNPAFSAAERAALIEAQHATLLFYPESSAKYHFSKHAPEFEAHRKKTTKDPYLPADYLASAQNAVISTGRGAGNFEQTGEYAVAYEAHNVRTVVRVERIPNTQNGRAYIATSYLRYM